MLRTSFYKDIISETEDLVRGSDIPAESKSKILGELLQLNIDTGLYIMQPSQRIETMENFYAELRKICPENLISRDTVAEFPFFTNIGRGELLNFLIGEQSLKSAMLKWNQTFKV